VFPLRHPRTCMRGNTVTPLKRRMCGRLSRCFAKERVRRFISAPDVAHRERLWRRNVSRFCLRKDNAAIARYRGRKSGEPSSSRISIRWWGAVAVCAFLSRFISRRLIRCAASDAELVADPAWVSGCARGRMARGAQCGSSAGRRSAALDRAQICGGSPRGRRHARYVALDRPAPSRPGDGRGLHGDVSRHRRALEWRADRAALCGACACAGNDQHPAPRLAGALAGGDDRDRLGRWP
jgi:hypothetical protein